MSVTILYLGGGALFSGHSVVRLKNYVLTYGTNDW